MGLVYFMQYGTECGARSLDIASPYIQFKEIHSLQYRLFSLG